MDDEPRKSADRSCGPPALESRNQKKPPSAASVLLFYFKVSVSVWENCEREVSHHDKKDKKKRGEDSSTSERNSQGMDPSAFFERVSPGQENSSSDELSNVQSGEENGWMVGYAPDGT